MKHCPLDKVVLSRTKYEHEAIWQCDLCHGMLVTESKIFAIKRKQNTSTKKLGNELKELDKGDTVRVISCPTCKSEMEKSSPFSRGMVGERGEVEDFDVDICPSCNAIWLDAGEIEKIQMDFQASTKGKEAGKHFVNYEDLSEDERNSYISTICESVPDEGKVAISSFLKGLAIAFFRMGSGSSRTQIRRF